ncbi:Hypothetical_protein [Hexamita inflata]|uniref:Hypothetical_protein n=1 Tax=Hexamita inflata TaxID=28002 RepID=A0AA86PR50_9EUKA|nr:Hypothetical protein HINF_LOCUS29528 [Hexamita inflata]
MSSIINEKHLMSAIQRLLDRTNSDISYVIYQVMVLPDVQYNLLFCQLSFDLNVKLETIHTLFSELSTKYLYVNQFPLDESFYTQQRLSAIETESQTESQSQSQNNSHCIQRRKINKQNDKIPLSQFKQYFSETVKTIIMEFDNSANEMTDKQICVVLQIFFQSHDQNLFWERVQKSITYKNKLQLKQYFQKSFLQCQYEQIISEQDRQKIVELTRAMPQSKPSEIVDVFFNQIGGEVYFRRKVVMFVQYLKKMKQE